MAVESFTEKMRRQRREKRIDWTEDDERRWLADHPDDAPVIELEPEVIHEDDLVPDIEPYERSDEDEAVDAVIGRIGIVEAYNRWAGKGSVNAGKRTESIKVRCPSPSHADHNPSAWLNTDKDVWVCGGCGMEGGDKFDIAAWGLGFPVPGYKDGKKFPELRRAMAADLGYVVTKQGKTEVAKKVSEPEPEETSPSAPEPEPADDEPSASVTILRPDPASVPLADVTEADKKSLKIAWQRIIPKDTFLWDWMEATTQDDLPEEYHFWTGLMAVGLALGHDVVLQDLHPVYGNLFITIIGRTASGKSRSVSHLTRLIKDAFPYDPDDPVNTGVKHVKGAGSGEVLIDSFVEMHEDDLGNPFTNPVRGLIEFNELAALVGKARQGSGSILKPILMDFYDHPEVITAASRTHGTMKAVDAHGSCITTTQPRAVRDLVTNADIDSGFLNRWLFIYGVDKTRVSYGLTPIDISKPVESAKSLKAWAATRRTSSPNMVLEGEALEMYDKFFHEKIMPAVAPSNPGEEDENPVLGRLELTFKKLILLFAANSKEANPSVKSVKRALSLWGYLSATYSKVSGSIMFTAELELENRIMALLQKYKDDGRIGAYRSIIADATKGRFSREETKQALQRLETLGLITEVTYKSGSRGRPRTVLTVAEE